MTTNSSVSWLCRDAARLSPHQNVAPSRDSTMLQDGSFFVMCNTTETVHHSVEYNLRASSKPSDTLLTGANPNLILCLFAYDLTGPGLRAVELPCGQCGAILLSHILFEPMNNAPCFGRSLSPTPGSGFAALVRKISALTPTTNIASTTRSSAVPPTPSSSLCQHIYQCGAPGSNG
jgi:hypothetical protein